MVDQVGFSAVTPRWLRVSHISAALLQPFPALHVCLQVTAQLQALLAEKARLAQENDRLTRENTGLQVDLWQHLQCVPDISWQSCSSANANLAPVAAGAASVHHAATHGTRGGRRAAA